MGTIILPAVMVRGGRREGGKEGRKEGRKVSGFYAGFFSRGEIRFYVFLKMYRMLCFPLVLLLSFIWQWFSKCKK